MDENDNTRCPGRAIVWTELNDSQRIERLREVVVTLRSACDRYARELDALGTHHHGPDDQPAINLGEWKDFYGQPSNRPSDYI